MHKQIRYLLIMFLLYVEPNVLFFIDYPYCRGGALTKINPSVILMFGYWLIAVFQQNATQMRTMMQESFGKWGITFFLLYVVNVILGKGGGLTLINGFLLIPLTACVTYSLSEEHLQKIVLSFFKLTCFVAVAEIMMGHHLFDLDPVLMEVDRCYNPIRATCFQGHALSNALIVDTILLFILFSDISTKERLVYLFMGLVATLCFGSRSSLLLWVGVIPIYMLFLFSNKRTSLIDKIGIVVSLAVLCYGAFYLLVNSQLGTRIMEHAEYDTSAEIRVRSFEAFNYLTNEELWWGYPDERYDYLKAMINVNAIENFYIIWILKFGIIITALLIFSMLHILYKSMTSYALYKKLIIITAFLIVASTNNSMATGGPFLAIFVLCAKAFKNKHPI